ncbi:M48 family peptidase [Psychromonas sp. RZ22]|uniref:M48 family metallopeptidase n=1 Tax=Psychromonas algarum TaxID=2555643 RepID=UPI00106823DA|nr:M48 family metallopeptidase [Psychromonas sp. RZ22]TEW55527.1 M48 family peptidase [Psychromonas sp. RZ22]
MKYSISTLFLLSTSVLLSACVTSSPTGRNQVLLFDGPEMAQLGEQSFAEMKKQEKINSDPKINTYVQCVSTSITNTLGKQPDFDQWEVVVFDSPQINAFALPGGKIGVYTGLLNVAKNQDQLAAVIGHEIAHVQANHSNERLSNTKIAGYGSDAGKAMIEGSEYQEMGMAALGLGVEYGIIMPYGRAQESEADIIGLKLMNNAGFDPQQSVDLWKNMAVASGGNEPMEFLSTHPSNKTRIQNLQQELKSLPKSTHARPQCLL